MPNEIIYPDHYSFNVGVNGEPPHFANTPYAPGKTLHPLDWVVLALINAKICRDELLFRIPQAGILLTSIRTTQEAITVRPSNPGA